MVETCKFTVRASYSCKFFVWISNRISQHPPSWLIIIASRNNVLDVFYTA